MENITHFTAGKWLFSDEFPCNIMKTFHQKRQCLHTHEFFEIVYMTKGRALHIVNGQKYSISKGDIFLLNDRDSHAYKAETRGGIEIINCIFSPSLLGGRECLKPFYNPLRYKLRLLRSSDISVRELLEKMFYEMIHKKINYEQLIKAYLAELLVFLNRSFSLKESEERFGKMSDLKKEAIYSAIEYIEKHYTEDLRLGELAGKAALTPNYFCFIFKKITSKSPIEYRNELRIKEACHLLRQSRSGITSIGFDVGFNDLSHFGRIFKKYTGSNPRLYRLRGRR